MVNMLMFVLGFLCIMPYANASGHCGEMCGDGGTCVSLGGSGVNDLICGPAEGQLKYTKVQADFQNGNCAQAFDPFSQSFGTMCLLNNNNRSNYVCLPNPGNFLTFVGILIQEVPICLGYSGVANYKQADGCADISYSNCTLYWTCSVNNVQSEAILMESSATGNGAIVQLNTIAGDTQAGYVQALACESGNIPPPNMPPPLKPLTGGATFDGHIPPPNMPPKPPTGGATFAAMPSFKLNRFTIFYTIVYLSIIASICRAF